jgi:hypothetical protein
MQRRAFRARRDVFEEPGMRALWRPLSAAAVLNVIVAAAAAAQTVVVTRAPPGAPVELAVNSAIVATATADSAGHATIPIPPDARGGKTESDAYVFVEYCGNLRRVILIEPGMQGLPGGECLRKEAPGVYIIRPVTTLVVDVSETAPSVLLRQGPAPASWLTDQVDRPRTGKRAAAPGRGLYLFGGGGVGSFANAVAFACGSNSTCTGGTKPATFSVGATFWLTPFLAAEGSYLKPGEVRLTGGLDTLYNYASTLQTDVLTMVGKVGLPTSYVRIYGFGGATFSRANWNTLQTIDDQTILVDDVETTVTGGAQSLKLFTQGWGWTAGGGFEVPVSKRVSIFGESGLARIKGNDRQGGEGKVNERVLYIIGGVRVRILG